MAITWFGIKEREGIASFYANNIILNTVASYPLLDAYRVQVGKDDAGRLLIVPVSKEKAESGVYDEYALLPYEVRRSFSHINSASLLKQIGSAKRLNNLVHRKTCSMCGETSIEPHSGNYCIRQLGDM